MDMSLLPVIYNVISLIVLITNVGMFVAIKFNDLKHIEIAVNELKTIIKEHSDKVDLLSERVARIEGKICITE